MVILKGKKMTYEEIVSYTRKKFEKTDVSSVDGVLAYQFNITGEGEGKFYVEIKDKQVHVEPYEYYDRNAIITMDSGDFLKLVDGKLDAVGAFMSGKLKVDGDLTAALRLTEFL